MGNEESCHSTGCVISAFFAGGFVGACVALLLAPRAGKETRQKIKEMAEEAKEKTTKYAGDVKGKVTSAVEKGKGLGRSLESEEEV